MLANLLGSVNMERVLLYLAGRRRGYARQIARFFDDLELVGPGLIDARHWEPLGAVRPPAKAGWHILTGVGRKN